MEIEKFQELSPGHFVRYEYKATMVFAGIYMFYLFERFLKWIINKNVCEYESNDLINSFLFSQQNIHWIELLVKDQLTYVEL